MRYHSNYNLKRFRNNFKKTINSYVTKFLFEFAVPVQGRIHHVGVVSLLHVALNRVELRYLTDRPTRSCLALKSSIPVKCMK